MIRGKLWISSHPLLLIEIVKLFRKKHSCEGLPLEIFHLIAEFLLLNRLVKAIGLSDFFFKDLCSFCISFFIREATIDLLLLIWRKGKRTKSSCFCSLLFWVYILSLDDMTANCILGIRNISIVFTKEKFARGIDRKRILPQNRMF